MRVAFGASAKGLKIKMAGLQVMWVFGISRNLPHVVLGVWTLQNHADKNRQPKPWSFTLANVLAMCRRLETGCSTSSGRLASALSLVPSYDVMVKNLRRRTCPGPVVKRSNILDSVGLGGFWGGGGGQCNLLFRGMVRLRVYTDVLLQWHTASS